MQFNQTLHGESPDALIDALKSLIKLANDCIENITDEEQLIIDKANIALSNYCNKGKQ